MEGRRAETTILEEALMRKLLAVGVLAVLAVPAPARAQEKGKVGITMGYPAAVGVLWHATENIAIRPEFTFSFSSADSDTGESDGSAVSVGVSALFYISRSDNLATYVSPRYSYLHSTSEAEFEGPQFIEDSIESSTNGHAFAGSFGAQYFLGTRFSVFGELGLSYGRTTRSTDRLDDEPRASTFGLASNVGVVLYF
jgi:hypothetical protein